MARATRRAATTMASLMLWPVALLAWAAPGSAQARPGTLAAPLSTGSGSATSVVQSVSVTVRPGGPLRVSPAAVVAVPGDEADSFLPLVHVVDPRGTLAGWVLHARLLRLRGASCLRVSPGEPLALGGDRVGLRRGRPREVCVGEEAELMSAVAGRGGGGYAVGARLDGSTPRRPPGAVIALDLH